MSQVIRVSSKIYSRLKNHVDGFDTPSGVIERLLDYYEGIESEDSVPSREAVSVKEMNRKQFVQSVGATCNNWTWSWSFINEEEKFVLFGAWKGLEKENGSLILTKEWEIGGSGRKAPGYKQALEHLALVENKGYQLKIFKMTGINIGTENAKITAIDPHIEDRDLKRVGDCWYAITD